VRFAAPIWTLLLLSPFIAEVLSGATRTSVLFVYVPEIMVWGVGALFCRELARRWQAGGVSLLLLGLALSIAEEFIIQQTSLAPMQTLACVAGPYWTIRSWPTIDIAGKMIFDTLGLIGLILLAKNVNARAIKAKVDNPGQCGGS
jgi:hypothetical protein